MHLPRHYPNAPITEAIIEFQVDFNEMPTDETWKRIGDQVGASYPTVEPVMLGSLQLQVAPQFGFNVSQSNSGIRYRSADGARVFQALNTGFTVTRLRPYDTWEAFRAETQRLWSVYKAASHPTAITRIALRYINRIELPGPKVELQTYLRISPEVADGFPNDLTGFFMQLNMYQHDLSASLIVNETLLPPPATTGSISVNQGTNVLAVVLDIGLSRVDRWDIDDNGVWNTLDLLRDRKNQVFEASITDDARKLFS